MVDWGYMPLYRESSSDDQQRWPLSREEKPVLRIILGIAIVLAILLYARS